MSLVSFIGPRPNLFDLDGQGRRKRLEVRQPILTNEDLEKIRAIGDIDDNPFQSKTLDITYPASKRRRRHGRRARRGCATAPRRPSMAAYNIIILSDRMVGPDRVPIPALLATAGVHHHLIRVGPAHLGRARRRDRRRARGPSFLRARRLRRRGDQPLSRLRDAARDDARAPRGASTTRRSSTATSRRSTRASSRSWPRWASRPTSPIAAPRSSTRSACRATSSTATSPAPRPPSRASASPRSPRRRCAATATPSATSPVLADVRSTSAATTPSACAARTMSGPPRRSRDLQHAARGNSRDKYRAFAKHDQRAEQPLPHHPRPVRARRRPRRTAAQPVPIERGRAGEARSSSASRPAPCPSARSAARRTPRWPSP